MPDDLDGDAFYAERRSPPSERPADSDDPAVPADAARDDDYELEPVDPDILAAEDRRTQHVAAAAAASVDIDALYRDAQQNTHEDTVRELLQGFPGRFQVKHLLILTAVIAVVLTLRNLFGLCMSIFLVGFVFLLGSLYLIQGKEKQHAAEAAERRRKVFARQRAERARQAGDLAAAEAFDQQATDAMHVPQSEVDRRWETAMAGESEFRFSFSMQQLFGALTVAAVVLGMTSFLGTEPAALVLGVVACVGIAAQIAGVQLPPLVALGWWLLLVLYILVSVFAAIRSIF